MKELTRVIGAVAQARPVEAGVRLVDFLRCVTLHEQVDGHHTCTLNREKKTFPEGNTRQQQKRFREPGKKKRLRENGFDYDK